ncbi:MAG: hypothetical protein JWP91_3737 [Fibrobacteres bacterium]|nr:hypothetical protein [Fibrobacterota bacterium]
MRSFLFAFSILLASVTARADDIDTLHARYLAGFLEGTRTPPETEARAALAGLKADGTWPDIDLAGTDQVNWAPRTHLDRIARLAKAYLTAGHALAGDAETAAKTALALDAYLKADPKSTNWWFNEIGAQLSLGPVAYMMRDRLTPAQKAGVDSILARSWRTKNRTGQNLVWVSRITIWRAVLNRDQALLAEAAAAVASTIAVTAAEGIQPDFSFHQHGAQLYNGGYGSGYASDGASLAKDLRGTRFAFTPGQLDILAGYLLDGERWMVRGAAFDHSARGREITRSGAGSANGIAQAALDLAPLLPPGGNASASLKAMAASIQAQSGSSAEGDKWFWRSEYLAHHRKGHSISLRMASKRLMASELVNNEGLLSQYLADGTTFLYRTGKEYDGAFPVWDWCHVPGTTASHAAAPPAMKTPAPGVGDFAGGVSDGTFGGAAFEYAKLGVTADKAWFFFDREMIALGAGLASTAADSLHTTVNQCLLNGPVLVATGSPSAPVAKEFAPGAALSSPALWILHDRIGYVIPEKYTQGISVPALSVGKASGNWRRINAGQSAENVDKDVFSLWINHGAHPGLGRYEYTTLMDVGAAELNAYVKDPAIAVLANTPALQAVRHKGASVILAAFHAPGPLTVDSRFTLTPERACMLLVREEKDRMVLGVSDPRRGTADLILTADVKLTGPGAVWSEAAHATTVTFALPKGDSAGATALRTFTTSGVGLRPAKGSAGLELSVRRNGGYANGSLIVRYRVPAAGEVRLGILDAQGRILAASRPGKVESGSHEWIPSPAVGLAEGPVSAKVFVRLEWEGRRLVAPLRPGIE